MRIQSEQYTFVSQFVRFEAKQSLRYIRHPSWLRELGANAAEQDDLEARESVV